MILTSIYTHSPPVQFKVISFLLSTFGSKDKSFDFLFSKPCVPDDLVSFLCGSTVPERPLGDSSLLKAEGDLEQRSFADGISIAAEDLLSGIPDAVGTTPPEADTDLLLKAEGDLEQQVGTRVGKRCQPYARLMGGGALAPPSPFGAVATAGPANPSDPVACHKHRGRKVGPSAKHARHASP